MEIIFVNSKRLSYKDIVKQLAVGLGMISTILIISFQKFPDTDYTLFIIFLIVLFLAWMFKSFTETTLKKVTANEKFEEFTFIIDKHFGREEEYSFNKSDLQFEHSNKPDRALPKNETLLIRNPSHNIEISVRQKGIGTETIKLITNHLKKTHNIICYEKP